jgi:hypothetical protein
MAHTESDKQLRRSNDLQIVREAIAVVEPRALTGQIRLEHVVEAIKVNSAPHGGRSWHDVRDQILTIATEWDLLSDELEQQSDECLHCLANFLR